MRLAWAVLTIPRQMKPTALKLAAVTLALALSARAADAQESAQQATTNAPPPAYAVPPASPPPVYAPMPPPVYVPFRPPVYAPPMLRLEAIDAAELARRGRQKEIAGVVLMVVGAAATVGGIAMSL